MKMNSDRWLLRIADNDDCEITSVGGAAFELQDDHSTNPEIDWSRFPVKEMIKRGWITRKEAIRPELFDLVPGWDRLCPLFRRTWIRCNKQVDSYSLAAWTARVVLNSQQDFPKGRFRPGRIDLAVMTEIAKLSVSELGLRQVRERLSEYGVTLVVEPHLPKTYLDGAALLFPRDVAIIGLTLRHDRIDNFWYALMHELAHLALHVGKDQHAHFFDDFDANDKIDPREMEADELASEALIPKVAWDASPAKMLPSKEAAELLATELDIHPAIVAGRMRYERSYKFLSSLVGNGGIRCQFPNIHWS